MPHPPNHLVHTNSTHTHTMQTAVVTGLVSLLALTGALRHPTPQAGPFPSQRGFDGLTVCAHTMLHDNTLVLA